MNWRLLIQLSLRSLVSHKAKSFIVGGIIFFGTLLLVLGLSLLDSIEASMQKSVTGSVTGHLQVYSANAEDELAIFGGAALGEDIGTIDSFAPVKEAIEALPNVKAVVPQGIMSVTVFGSNEFDDLLEAIRVAARDGEEEALSAKKSAFLNLVRVLEDETRNSLAYREDKDEVQKTLATLAEVQSEPFWMRFDMNPEKGVLELSTQIASIKPDGRMFFMRILGTDLELFPRSFDRFELVQGELVPQGQRGMLLNQRFRERFLKNYVARGFDELKAGLEEKELSIADDDGLKTRVRQNVRQAGTLLYELSAEDAAELEAGLRAMLPGVAGDRVAVLEAFLDVNDANFSERYDFFYAEIAPRITLYELPVGETVTVRGVTQSGTFEAVNVKIYGVYTFKGLERSDLSGAFNLTDLMTFRDLFGQMTDEQRAELRDIKEDVGVEDVPVEVEAREDAMFGGGDEPLVKDADTSGESAFERVSTMDLGAARREALANQTFTTEDIEQGLVLNAAIVLEDPSEIEDTMEAVQAVIDSSGLPIQVVDWQEASGLVGQFVIVIRLVLYVAIVIIFLVALVIINNSMVMATMDRVGEIGTMRAIGAQRGFVMAMFLAETFVLGIIAGGIGALVGVGLVLWMGAVGLPASNDVMVFLFSGPRLYPEVGIANIFLAILVIILVTIGSTLYPARIATRVQPIEAMHTKE